GPGKKLVNGGPPSPDNPDAHAKLPPPYTPQFEEQQNWRKTAPAPGPDVAFHLPIPKTFTMTNGVQVYMLEDHSLPVFSAAFVLRAGSEADTPAKAGLAAFTSRLLTEGTTQRSATVLA